MGFGSSSLIDEYESDVSLSVAAFRAKHGDAFLLVDGGVASSVETDFDDATDPNIPLRPSSRIGEIYVFEVKKRTTTEFSFIALGRNLGNDLFVPHQSVSRFHAYFRPTDAGMVLQDAKSSSGIWLDAAIVPKPTEGEPLLVRPGATLRFGAISATFVDAAGMIAALKAALNT